MKNHPDMGLALGLLGAMASLQGARSAVRTSKPDGTAEPFEARPVPQRRETYAEKRTRLVAEAHEQLRNAKTRAQRRAAEKLIRMRSTP